MVVGVAIVILATVGSAFAARGFSERADDLNAAPDITGVDVSEATPGTLTVRLTVANFQTLPPDSWVNLWFDTDSNQQTGADGDEALVRHVPGGQPKVFRWNGATLLEADGEGITSSSAEGALTVTIPRATIGATAPFGLLVVTSRGQPVADEVLIASDFLPNAGRLAFAGTETVSTTDPAGDHDAAPDLAAVRVSDAASGWITFDMTTPNYAVLPESSVIVLTIDADASSRTGDSGADIQLTLAGGEVAMDRWAGRGWQPAQLPTRARSRNAANRVSIDLHRSELGASSRLRFSLLSADVNTAIPAVVAVDIAPDGFSYWPYTLVHKAAVTLTARAVTAVPRAPISGRRFAVAMGVTRSDTRRPITAGAVSCTARAGGRRVTAEGGVDGGVARCVLTVPAGSKGRRLRGTIAVRTAGARVTRAFSYVIR